MLDLGSMIEARRGSFRLAGLVLVLAIVSNLAQYAFNIPSLRDWPDLPPDARFQGSPNFGGISGVVFGLVGYIWMKSRFAPDSGFFLPRQSLIIVLVWFALCIIGVIPRIANTAHTVGLLLGMAIGYGSSLWAKRRARS
jgi:GlpG protein